MFLCIVHTAGSWTHGGVAFVDIQLLAIPLVSWSRVSEGNGPKTTEGVSVVTYVGGSQGLLAQTW